MKGLLWSDDDDETADLLSQVHVSSYPAPPFDVWREEAVEDKSSKEPELVVLLVSPPKAGHRSIVSALVFRGRRREE